MGKAKHDHALDPIAARHAPMEEHDLAYLTTRYPGLPTRDVILDMNLSSPSFFDELVAGFAKGRRGEALLAVRHQDGRIWLQTKDFYPAGIYRLPTGGIGENETALDAARRELWEETGLRAEPASCAGILRYRLERGGRVIPFITYLFLFDGGAHTPTPQDAGERISDMKLISIHDLPDVANSLRETPSRWQDWGQFRALAHEFLFERLQDQG